MITGALIVFWCSMLAFLVSLLPTTSGIPDSVNEGIGSFVNAALSWDYWFPVSTVFNVIFIYLVFEFVLWSWIGVKWSIRFVRG